MTMAAKILVRGRSRFFMAMAKDQSFHTYFSGNSSALLGRVSHRAPTSGGSWLEQSLSRSGGSLRELQRSFSVLPAAGESNDRQQKDISEEKPSAIAEKPPGSTSGYWGINSNKVVKEDGSPWPWYCFQPADSYQPDITIDLKKHHRMDSFLDSVAFWIVKFLRVPTDVVPQKQYVYRVMMLETVAAVPGMVGGMLLHLRSLRKFEHSGGWIKALLEEAENERMHLMTWIEVKRPNWLARALVFIVQGGFFNTYFVAYICSPRLAHRIVGYLEEEAVYSYTKMLAAIDNGIIPNSPAPSIAIDYWRLPKDATIRDVVVVIRADEAHHRDVNHFAADAQKKGKSLREVPAPVGFR